MAATTVAAPDTKTASQIAQVVTGSTAPQASAGLGVSTTGSGFLNPVSPTAQNNVGAVSTNASSTVPLSEPSPLPGGSSAENSVSGRVDAILAGDSPLMRRAKAEGLQAASRRGLGNSSMAAQASQAAMLNAATPIASQEAQQQAAAELAAADAAEKARLQREQLAAASADSLAKTAAEERARMLAALTDLTGQRFNALSNTLANHKIKADARNSVISSINDQYQSTMNYMQNLYGVSLNNLTPAGAATGAATAPAPTATTQPASTFNLRDFLAG